MDTIHEETNNRFPFRSAVGYGLLMLGFLALLPIKQWALTADLLTLHEQARINGELLYQGITTLMALVFLGILFLLFPRKFRRFARFGDPSATGEPVKWLGIGPDDPWRSVGTSFALIITLVTAVTLFFTVLGGQLPPAEALRFVPWVLLAALTNSFVEEAYTRFGVVVSFYGVLPNRLIYLIAGLSFGIPHYFGTPGGPFGVLLTVFLGWLLAKSIVETRGVFWAWFVHFLQDVGIFFVLFALPLM